MLTKLLAKWFFWIGQAAMPTGRIGARLARFLFVRAQFLDPKLQDARAWQCLVEAMFARARGNSKEALRLLREASDLLPANDAIIANLGIELAMAGHYDEAVQVIERAIRGELDITGEPQVWMALGWSYLRSGRAPKALQVSERAEECNAVSNDLRVIRVLAHAVCHGFVQRAQLSRLVGIRPRTLSLLLDFVQHCAQAGSRDLARQVIRCLPTPTQLRAFQVVARSALNADDHETALWALKQYEIGSPGSPYPPRVRAEIAMRQGDLQAALKNARIALLRAPKDARILEQAVRVYVTRGELEQALEAARSAVRARTKDALAGGIWALHLLDEGRTQEARKLFVVQRSGDGLACAYGYTAQALIAILAGNWDQGLEIAQQAVLHFSQLPEWAATPAVVDNLTPTIRQALDLARAQADGLSRQKADELERRLTQAVAPTGEDQPPT